MRATRRRILVVDDEEDHLEMLTDILEGKGFIVSTARSAGEGLRAAVDLRPDLVLSDMVMPEEDGLALIRRLKGDKRTAMIPTILMSGVHHAEDDQSEGIEKGADDYLAKPLSPDLLFAKVRAVLRRFAGPAGLKGALKTEELRYRFEK